MVKPTILRWLVICIGIIAGIHFTYSTPMLSGTAMAGPKAEAKNPFGDDPEAVARGSEIFDEYCSECHGTGTGGAGPNLTDMQWTYGGSDAEVFASVSGGRNGMPAMSGELGDEEIWKVISFLRSIKDY